MFRSSERGEETLQWWYLQEDKIIEYIEIHFSENLFIGKAVESGSFKGLRRIVYGKSRHYAVHEKDRYVDIINILPSRTKRKRVTK